MNHDDIEGLFREAAENYQVNTDRAFDWDKVQKGIHEPSDDDIQPVQPKEKDRKRFIFWLFLLLAVTLFSYTVWYTENHKTTQQEEVAKSGKQKAPQQSKQDDLNSKGPAAGQQTDASSALPEGATGSAPVPSTLNATGKESQRQQQGNSALSQESLRPLAQEETMPWSANDGGVRNFLKKPWNYSAALPVTNNQTTSNEASDTAVTKVTEKATTDTLHKSSTEKKGKKGAGYFYAGALLSPDFTFVKFQKTQGLGTTVGLTAGYRFKNNFSIETGLLLDTKKYYTKGDYFDKSHIPYLQYAKLVSVDGSCHMFEIPLNIRYNFPARNANHNFTASVGTSTYLMTKESYHYSAESYGQWREGSYTNQASSTNVFSVINLSAGYEKYLSSGLSLRAEPYYKIPVRKIGTGKLYMTSAGINIGVTKYFGKK